MQPSVLLADDHVVVRQAIRALLEQAGYPVIGEASDGEEALRLARELRPDVAILDLRMPLLNGIDAAIEIVRILPHTRTILLTMYADEKSILRAMRSGVHGYVLKSQPSDCLTEAIRQAVAGGVYLSPGVPETVLKHWLEGKEDTSDELSSRERRIVQLVAQGRSTKDIAEILNISPKTVETYRSRLMSKLGVHDTPSLVRYAVRNGLVDTDYR